MAARHVAYYAVRKGRNRGIYYSWTECEAQVKGFSRPEFKKFSTSHDAHQFLRGIVQDTKPLTAAKPKKRKPPKKIPAPAPGTRVIWTDGACRCNGTDNAVAGVGVYFGPRDPRNLSEPLEGAQTNQRAELKAVIRALQVLAEEGDLERPVQIRTDSRYVQRGLHQHLPRWKVRGWKTTTKTAVKNRELWECLDALYAQFVDVTLVHVRGHSGDAGNEAADRLAVAGSRYGRK